MYASAASSRQTNLGNEAQLEVGAPAFLRVLTIEHQRAVDPDLLGARVHAEGTPRPQDDVRVLAGFQRPDPVLQVERPRRVDGDPLDGFVRRDGESYFAARSHRLRGLLIE